MGNRYVSVWFRFLKTDWLSIRNPAYRQQAFVLHQHQKGRSVITAVNRLANEQHIGLGMTLADAKAMVPQLLAANDEEGRFEEVLHQIAIWFIRYTPVVALDVPDGILLDASGCAHLWGSEEAYLNDITNRLNNMGYTVRVAMGGTVGTAWALCHYGQLAIAKNGEELQALSPLPFAALRIDALALAKLQKMGFKTIKDVLQIPLPVLRRRFGQVFITKLQQALGAALEVMDPVVPPQPFAERLYCLDPILSRVGIELALKQLLNDLCTKLKNQHKGLRTAELITHSINGRQQEIRIGTNKPNRNSLHLFKLFELKLQTIAPGFGIELFLLQAPLVEDLPAVQESIWQNTHHVNNNNLLLLMDKLTNQLGEQNLCRYTRDERHWPERAIKKIAPLEDVIPAHYEPPPLRPILLLKKGVAIEARATANDIPISFTLHGEEHQVVLADGPERIAGEWWIETVYPRDYYYVEDQNGNRYWIFKLVQPPQHGGQCWFLHGYFA
ncbi:MAG: DNA polymerase Y family protein [Bacteroidetes bacterium]|nr:MAG: DNA polymerase Y family protein [Bacteroidota bacterium]